jgi:hypothetical protein
MLQDQQNWGARSRPAHMPTSSGRAAAPYSFRTRQGAHLCRMAATSAALAAPTRGSRYWRQRASR